MQTQKLIAFYEKRIENLEKVTNLQTELLKQQEEKIAILENYCRLCEKQIETQEKQLTETKSPKETL